MKSNIVSTTYAQYNEDNILYALLHDVEKGFYVDIGANYPTIDSVTKIFYEKGWSGINIEPIKKLYLKIEKERPRDINLNIGVGDREEEKLFYENIKESGHSSFVKNKALEGGGDLLRTKIKIDTLSNVLSKYAQNIKINFMKIDVEGFEYQVVNGNNWEVYRPEVICIEANHISSDWRPLLHDNNYKLFIADGLNEYYVAVESWHRTHGFAERVIMLNYTSLKQHQADLLKNYERAISLLEAELNGKHKELESARRYAHHSLMGKKYHKRLLIALYDLTFGWFKERKDSTK
jgi:FkbM family methyltransferase